MKRPWGPSLQEDPNAIKIIAGQPQSLNSCRVGIPIDTFEQALVGVEIHQSLKARRIHCRNTTDPLASYVDDELRRSDLKRGLPWGKGVALVPPSPQHLQFRISTPPSVRHPPQGPLDRPATALLPAGVEPSHDVALGEDPVVSDQLVEHRQDLGANATFRPTRTYTHPKARQAHQSRFRLGYRHLRSSGLPLNQGNHRLCALRYDGAQEVLVERLPDAQQ